MYRISHELGANICGITACDSACTSVLWRATEHKLTPELLEIHAALHLNAFSFLRDVDITVRYTGLH